MIGQHARSKNGAFDDGIEADFRAYEQCGQPAPLFLLRTLDTSHASSGMVE
jgi:hypothetical protein